MKKCILALLVVASAQSAFAGKMKEIWQDTNDSVLATLGFDEGDVTISGYKFAKDDVGNLTLKTVVKGKQRVQGVLPVFECTTVLKGTTGNYRVVDTLCEQVN